MADGNKGVPTLLLALLAGAALMPTSVVLLGLLWRYVPQQAAVLAELGGPIPFSGRLVIAASNWAIRLLPFLVVLGLPFVVAIVVWGLVLAAKRGRARRLVRAVAVAALLVALCQALASAAIVQCLRAAIQQARGAQQLGG